MECSDTPTDRMDKVQRVGLLTMMTVLLASVLASCGGGEEEAAQEEETTSDEMVVGGFGLVGPTGELIEVPAVTTDPSEPRPTSIPCGPCSKILTAIWLGR